MYTDTLGCPIPENLLQCLKNLNNAVGSVYKGGSYDESNFIIAHFHNGSKERQCTSSSSNMCFSGSIVFVIVLSSDTFLSSILKKKSTKTFFLAKYVGQIQQIYLERFCSMVREERGIDLSLLNMGSIILQVSAFDLVFITMKTNKEEWGLKI